MAFSSNQVEEKKESHPQDEVQEKTAPEPKVENKEPEVEVGKNEWSCKICTVINTVTDWF